MARTGRGGSSPLQRIRGRPGGALSRRERRIVRTMRRLVTLALALGLTALVAAAAVDALRGEEVRRADPPTPRDNDTESSLDVRVTAPAPSRFEDREALAARLERNGVDGTLFLSADRCLDGRERRLRALDLSDLAFDPRAAGAELPVHGLARRRRRVRPGGNLEPESSASSPRRPARTSSPSSTSRTRASSRWRVAGPRSGRTGPSRTSATEPSSPGRTGAAGRASS